MGGLTNMYSYKQNHLKDLKTWVLALIHVLDMDYRKNTVSSYKNN